MAEGKADGPLDIVQPRDVLEGNRDNCGQHGESFTHSPAYWKRPATQGITAAEALRRLEGLGDNGATESADRRHRTAALGT